MYNPHTKFEMSTTTCNKDMKGNAKWKNRSEPHFWGIRGNAHGLYIARWNRIVDFLLVIIELFSLALTSEALLSEICWNRRFTEGVCHFERKF